MLRYFSFLLLCTHQNEFHTFVSDVIGDNTDNILGKHFVREDQFICLPLNTLYQTMGMEICLLHLLQSRYF